MIYNKSIKYTALLVMTILLSACGGGDDGPGVPEQNPKASTLVFPIQNSECNEGSSISETESLVTFEWNESANTNSYTVVLENLTDNTTRNIPSNNTTKEINLLKGIPYSWYVISESNVTTTTANSETWKFYNAGEGVENYAPFPADLVSPTMGSTTNTSVTLNWTGSDIDNDIDNYDVYFGTSNPPNTLQESTTNLSININSLTANTVYYWRVISNDSHGNNSQSPIFEFITQ
ncbi:hypothetical protein D1818_04995 [Aquimarina sp. BL5]|uniref:fibronectin type III domain-containing protein n=1 Tax=Aquimarina sp. BL5 TaxID=1714860 RepID=UPI000E46D45C|nr:fibronectin type III domain-containing protein [Aquimarina sp. BL5]AXT50214.1 hypothetical protein D1818_04995 [Aquimarina sp. BL5]RKN09534.1 hypothetical protein D7036_03870 [Aquimarina sp. BL5]